MSRVYRALQKAEREKEEKPREERRPEEYRAEEFRTEKLRPQEPPTEKPRTEEFRAERPRTEQPRTEQPITEEPRTEQPRREPRAEEQHRATVKEKIVARIDQGISRRPEIKPELHELPIGDEASVLTVPPDSFAAEQFRKLKTEIFNLSANPPHIILVTSTTPSEGKSTVSFNLALSISQEIQKKAILVDADLRRPSILFKKHKTTKGLSNYLSDRIPLTEVLIRFEENFWIIPAGPSSRKASELLGTRRMKELLTSLREFGEDTYTIIDSPPILSTSEPAMLSKMVDAVILVVKADQTPRESIRRAVQNIDRQKIVGVVFNQVELKSLGYYSKYYHGYYGK